MSDIHQLESHRYAQGGDQCSALRFPSEVVWAHTHTRVGNTLNQKSLKFDLDK